MTWPSVSCFFSHSTVSHRAGTAALGPRSHPGEKELERGEDGPQASPSEAQVPGGSQRDRVSPSTPRPRLCTFLGEEAEVERNHTLPSEQQGCDSGGFWRILEDSRV